MKKIVLSSLLLLGGQIAFSQTNYIVEKLKDINPNGAAFPNDYSVYNGKLYFDVDDGVHGNELWVTDGTEAGTHLFKDIAPLSNTGAGRGVELTEYNGKAYFSASDGTTGLELWVTDGTPAGTKLFKNISDGSNPERFIKCNNKLYFIASDTTYGRELWVTDGTLAGTQIVKDINPTGDAEIEELTVYNDKLYFVAAEDGEDARELWVSDGTASGTKMLKDIFPGANGSFPEWLTVYDGKLYFAANDSTHSVQLWVTDGSTSGTHLFKDLGKYQYTDSHGFPTLQPADPELLTVAGGKLFFTVDTENEGRELWVTDGTSNGTHLVSDILTGAAGSKPRGLTAFSGKIYFNASNNTWPSNLGLWVSDGTAAGTRMVKDINTLPPSESSDPRYFQEYNNKLFFIANEGVLYSDKWNLWVTDGTDTGTYRVAPNIVSNSSPLPESPTMYTMSNIIFTVFDGSLYFPANFDSTGIEIYKLTDTSSNGGGNGGTEITAVEQSAFILYPNPSANQVTVSMEKNVMRGIQIINTLGQVVLEQKFDFPIQITTVSVKHLTKGIYYLTVNTGLHKVAKPFVIE